MDPESASILNIFLFLFRIGITIYCVNRAGELNRSKTGWGVFGFLLPLVAVIWIQFVKPVMVWEDNPSLEEKNPDILP